MANFIPAFEKMIRHEGGFILENVQNDLGGQTYAGIARNHHSDWDGWQIIDRNDIDNPQLTQKDRNFYEKEFWNRCKGDKIKNQKIAESIFDFSVNAGSRTAAKLAQLVIDATPDGVIGPKTLEKLNDAEEELFTSKFALAKVARYTEICRRNPVQKKFLLGWINRTLGELS